MMVVMPFTRQTPECVEALNATGREWVGRDVSASDSAYFDLLTELWAARQTFCLVEHDIIVTADALDGLEACDSDWCVCPYPYGAAQGGLHAGLGCVRFRGSLLERTADALERVAALSDRQHPHRHWCRLDHWLQQIVLPGMGERMCVHATAVGHHGSLSPAHGCV